jgi:uncharacterized protein (DUF488 family)
MTLYTIGFTKSTAERFFGRLREAGVARLIDTRLRRDGQLAGFAKIPDLEYFARELAGVAYAAEPLLVPTAELLDAYRDKVIAWDEYASAYRALLVERAPERTLSPASLANACLLCSEHSPEHCHRSLAADYLAEAYPAATIEIVHL